MIVTPNTDTGIQAFVVFFNSEGEPSYSTFAPVLGWKLFDGEEMEEMGVPDCLPIVPGAWGARSSYCLVKPKEDFYWGAGDDGWRRYSPEDATEKLEKRFARKAKRLAAVA